ncbi:chorismate mutase [Alkalihalobacillus trypoxylicola]|uniref:chorismate mutase n=1 Tax=Alkalihalobacillus trypoxylicola TaxID=519424 RepID=A0A162EGZ9_9BACI|nr:chorismate mutase [Alkalihalobacillus trypoxylicola]KYG32863.1 chorismate mutase [Alkalihalobacillus trypoxylicola]GAF65293.1 chorismate mutase [Bacillus sp. TS-2]
MVRGIRGATTVKEDREDEILKETEYMVQQLVKENEVNPEDVAQVLITVTDDISSTFPAKALRRFPEWKYVPVMCAREIAVPNSLEKCIRIMVTVNSQTPQEQINHIYLNNAVQLRPDLLLTDEAKKV